MEIEQHSEGQKEIFLEHLRDEIWQVAQEMGVELTAEELRVAWAGSKIEEEMWVPFKLGDRASDFSLKAKDTTRSSKERREAGVHSLVLKAATYLRGSPETSAECLQYARDVWSEKYVWDERDVPQPIPTPQQDQAIKEEKEAA
ncbi:MAG: hypothetical protein Q8Q95_00235 [bacterium]|nr:hypothetical protein [bacterium]